MTIIRVLVFLAGLSGFLVLNERQPIPAALCVIAMAILCTRDKL